MESTNATVSSVASVEEPRRTRASAKHNVAQSWASRRQQTSSSTVTESAGPAVPPPPKPLPVCVFLKSIWSQTSEWFRLQQQHTTRRRKSRITTSEQRPLVFESVTRQYVAKAVASHAVEENDVLTSVLPAGYDFTQAIQSLAKSRCRAFLLLDLAAVCKAHVQLQKSLPFVELQYSCALNRNDRLLKLLTKLQTSLRCNSNQDVVAAAQATEDSPDTKIVDHAGATRKPNGYLKRISAYTNSFAVDGPDEVHRIHDTLARKAAKEQSEQSATTRGFVLRLPDNDAKWKELVLATRCAAQDRKSRLDGISVDLTSHLDNLEGLIQSLQECCSEITCGETKFRIDVTGLPSSGLTPSLRILFESLVQSIPNIAVTADVSHMLVAHAGALCTRIIGVKRSNQGNDKSNVIAHYYIDDGCYGSLQSGLPGHEFSPMPLTNVADNSDGTMLVPSTVWGPTCDGLDRVCREVLLPPLGVNDWLVFPNLGCGGFGGGLGLGTAFNGFEPPDIAFCVLGYFRQT